MARGMVVNEPIVSQAQTRAFDEGYDAAGLGKSEEAKERGRFVWDAERKCLVRAEDYRPPPAKCGTEIMADRVHEGTFFDAGNGMEDIGSKSKRRQFMKAHGLEDATDATPEWRESIKKQQAREDAQRRRAAMERAARELYHQGKWR